MLKRELRGLRLCLDANIWVYARESAASSTWGEPARALIVAAQSGELKLVTSAWSLAEVLIAPIRERDRAAQKHLRELLDGSTAPPWLLVRAVDREVLLEAARLTALHPIALPDAIHAATSKLARCKYLISNDAALCAALGAEALPLGNLQLEE